MVVIRCFYDIFMICYCWVSGQPVVVFKQDKSYERVYDIEWVCVDSGWFWLDKFLGFFKRLVSFCEHISFIFIAYCTYLMVALCE